MATTKVSDLSALTSPDGSEELLVNDGGTSKKITIANATGITLTADNNIGLGANAVDSITTGDNNVGLGVNALTANTTGSSNTGIGRMLQGPLGGGGLLGRLMGRNRGGAAGGAAGNQRRGLFGGLFRKNKKY